MKKYEAQVGVNNGKTTFQVFIKCSEESSDEEIIKQAKEKIGNSAPNHDLSKLTIIKRKLLKVL